jgi:hypothetical protein
MTGATRTTTPMRMATAIPKRSAIHDPEDAHVVALERRLVRHERRLLALGVRPG